eukprot:2195289-Rhodomonas_salina.1
MHHEEITILVRGRMDLWRAKRAVENRRGAESSPATQYEPRDDVNMARGAGVQPQCPKCKLPGCERQGHQDATSGMVHDYCCAEHEKAVGERGGSHKTSGKLAEADGREDATSQRTQTEQSRAGMRDPRPICKLDECGIPVYVDDRTGRVFDYCSRTHAEEDGAVVPTTTEEEGGRDRPTCRLATCDAPVYVDEQTGQLFDYCSQTHAEEDSATRPAKAKPEPLQVKRIASKVVAEEKGQ